MEGSLLEGLDEMQRNFLSGAADQVAMILQGVVPNPEEILAGVGRLIDVAVSMMPEEGRQSVGAQHAAPHGESPQGDSVGARHALPLPASRSDVDSVGAQHAAPLREQHQIALFPDDLESTMLEDFLSESGDNVHFAEGALLALETDPSDTEAVNTIFRAFHTLKGMAAFLNFKHVADLAHHSESFLSKVRDGAVRYTEEAADIALRSVDLMKELLAVIRASSPGDVLEQPDGYAEHMRAFEAIERGETGELRLGEILVASGRATSDEVEAVGEAGGEEPFGLELVKAGAASVSDVGQALRKQRKAKDAEAVEGSMRVRTDRMDRLFNLVGELVIAQSMMDQDGIALAMERPSIAAKIQQASKSVRELQEICMAMRMVPLKATFQKMARLVRDLTRRSGKRIRFETAGEETEIDRTLVEVVSEFLVHMVRNSADHGVEAPMVREDAGKEPEGVIRLSASHGGGNVIFEIADDGKGLDRDRILRKALERGLVAPDRALTDAQIHNLIFEAGFSTAETVTDVSGRGVGMDVVRQGIEALKGSIEIFSEPGEGSRFVMRVPLTMAITDAMIVRVGGERYIIPTIKIKQSVRPAPGEIATVQGGGAEMLRYMQELIPVVRLHEIFRLKPQYRDLGEGILVVVEETTGRYALFIDELLGQAQVVAKPLGEAFGKIPGIASGAILGDGRVGLILDTAELRGEAA
jgi:two-component system chemotaxis sensor kinase CheA